MTNALLWSIALVFGIAAGAGAYTFVYAEGASYLRDDPAACANCHVMQEHLDAWERSPHRSVAVCNDCHAPHGSFAAKYAVKGINGLRHGWAFTTGGFETHFEITPLNREVTESACRSCHAPVVHAIDSPARPEPTACLHCHGAVGHGP